MAKVHFTADTHFGHRSILRMCQRQFDSIEEHDATLVELWNSVVRPNDEVWHLGDFSYRAGVEHAERILKKLNGRIHLVRGNHDRPAVLQLTQWASVQDFAEIKLDGQRISLFHYGMRTWPAQWHNSIQLYGHSHTRLPGNTRSLDVGVDAWGYMPVDIEQIRARMATLPEWRPEEVGDEPEDENESVSGYSR